MIHRTTTLTFTEPAQLRRITRRPMLVILPAAEILPQHVLAPALGQCLIAQVEGMLQIQERHHQTNRKPWTPGRADACSCHLQRRPEQIVARYRTPLAILVCECRRQRLLQAFPGHAPGQHRQGVREVDHLVDAGPEEVVRGHGSGLRFSQFLLQALYFPGVPAPSKGLRIKWSCGS